MEYKIWFITGISSGLGKALAHSVMENGDFVIGTFRQQTQVDDFNKENEGKAFAILLDISDEKSIEQKVEKLMDSH